MRICNYVEWVILHIIYSIECPKKEKFCWELIVRWISSPTKVLTFKISRGDLGFGDFFGRIYIFDSIQ